ncbi:hypothetical protein F4775DRAFT_563012 [Biscogniauxia sp. FL1348]|nr:hypothetical protein F4775DRAFT_563012 [Biscogniauxia sp. FL1348]
MTLSDGTHVYYKGVENGPRLRWWSALNFMLSIIFSRINYSNHLLLFMFLNPLCTGYLYPPMLTLLSGLSNTSLEAHELGTLSSSVQGLPMSSTEKLQERDEKRKTGKADLLLDPMILADLDEFKRGLSSWLGTALTVVSYNNYVQRRLEGTCDWILQRSEFVS